MKNSLMLSLAVAGQLLAGPAFAQGSGRDVTILRMSGPQLGVRVQEVDKDAVARLKLKEERGALVDEVLSDSAAERAGIGRIGWHTFRHTYSTLLHAYGTDMKVQQELLRHSDIRTTMNIYTHTVSSALREANSKVVRMILPERKTA